MKQISVNVTLSSKGAGSTGRPESYSKSVKSMTASDSSLALSHSLDVEACDSSPLALEVEAFGWACESSQLALEVEALGWAWDSSQLAPEVEALGWYVEGFSSFQVDVEGLASDGTSKMALGAEA